MLLLLIHLGPLSCIVFNVFVLVEGQGQFVLPPTDNYSLPLDSYRAGEFFVVFCFYNETGATPDYMFRRNGAAITTGMLPNQSVAVVVPGGDYTSSVEGTYTCSVNVNGVNRGSRNTIVSLPGKHCTLSQRIHFSQRQCIQQRVSCNKRKHCTHFHDYNYQLFCYYTQSCILC